MNTFVVTDLRHFEPEDPTVELPPRVLRLRRFFGQIARAASVRDSGEWSTTALRCRRKPERKPCSGRLELFRRDVPAEVEWRCPDCGDGGVVTGWRHTFRDLSGPPTELAGDPEGARIVQVDLSQEEYELLRDRAELFELESERIVARARPTGPDRVVLSGRLDDWDFLLGEVAFVANHTDDRILQRRLEALAGQVDSVVRRAAEGG